MQINKSYFDKVFLEAVAELRKLAPKHSGNLAYNAIKYKWIGDNKFVIYVDVGDTASFMKTREYEEGVAPYMPFTNEKWISPRWNGTQNPNESWWNDAMEVIINYIAKKFNGELR